MKTIVAYLVCLAFLVSIPADGRAEESSDVVVNFKGRRINLSSFLNAFPYDQWRWAGSLHHDVMYCLKKEGDKVSICRSDLGKDGQPAVLGAAPAATSTDFAKSLTFEWKIHEVDGSLFFTMDENNNESFNLHRLDRSGQVTKLTNVNYVAGFGFSPDGKQVAYSDRTGPEGSRFKIHLLDLATRTDRVIAMDSADQQFTWYGLSWQPDGKGIVLTTLSNGTRTRGNLSWIRTDGTEDQRPVVLTDPTVSRTFPEATKYWLNDEEVLVVSNESGAANLFALNIKQRKQRPLSAFGSDVSGVFLIKGTSQALVVVKNPLGSQVYRLNVSETLPKPELVLEETTDLKILDVSDDQHVLYHKKSGVIPFQVESFHPGNAAATKRSRIVMEPALIREVVQSNVEAVMFDTFDKVPMTLGERLFQGKIHGFLYSPRESLPEQERILVVESFYGGGNEFNVHTQILCAAGIHVFSPAPRGVANVSAAFELLNDGDLGGFEVVDVMYGAKFMSDRLKIPPSRVGVFGHSHGGYETMRHLTFPETFGPVKFRFPWGFGIAESGFASIKGQYDGSNIKEWIAKEAGAPSRPGILQQWEDRSPINHAERLSGNLLLIHGTTDKRVPYAESKTFYDKLVALGKKSQATLVPLEGVGHVAIAKKDILERYAAWFRFLAEQK
jgi:dipeptidyl aminopeptidase/acylaminoacyl peptidase